MKKKILALVLALAMLLGACGSDTDAEVWYIERLYADMDLVPYSAMTYTRPDMTHHDTVLAESCRIAREGKSLDRVLDAIYDYYDVYDEFYTCSNLAYIHYSADLTDIYWEQEYTWCAEQSATVDAGLDELYHALADSPYRLELEGEDYFGEGYFDYYDGESIWDETFTALIEAEAALINQYYDWSTLALEYTPGTTEYLNACAKPMAELYVEMVKLRGKIASYLGYDNYSQFAYDFYYYRDYTPEQVDDYLPQIQQELVPLYRELSGSAWSQGYRECTEAQTYAYLKSAVANMGGMVESAFDLLDRYHLYDITAGENKYASSFEVYLLGYYEPFIFMDPQGMAWDKLTLVHEFGHFANDYACFGSMAGIDGAEVYSQALEYLSLCYADGGEDLTTFKMADSLCIFVEQAAYADFENRIYALDPETITVDRVVEIFEQVGQAYGFDTWAFDPWDFVQITHFFTNPQYVISYVVSNDAAMQIYQMELDASGTGLGLYQAALSSTDSDFLSLLDHMGLESPFAPGRVAQLRQTLVDALN